ncbi:hypothetical protein LY474_22205 [Myxococcus stipitatus]|uniref:hypothetical protein n=1 Tax=Myxococcus stipitatus TaxID=83455 RepID=UPI001F1D7DFB|nr:hypothetical protein [Myxococcus stipitatus]MCE9670521.1 hypothetical protein [Myxococcus stipitatus]
MSTPMDPLLESEATDRTYYATGVLLDPSDFDAEQSYHRGRLARSLAALHGPGTASGLRVLHEPYSDPLSEAEVAVLPGLAVDPLGRLVEVASRACIRVKRWYEGFPADQLLRRARADFGMGLPPAELPEQAVVADLFVRFRVYARGWTPALASGLYDATDAVSPARLRDGFELRLVPRLESAAQPLPTVPVGPWPRPAGGTPFPGGGGDEAARRSALKKAILDSWLPSRQALLDRLWGDAFLPHALRFDASQPGGKVADPAWVFLARVAVGVTAAVDGGGRPVRSGTVAVDNEMRPFAVTVAALARWLGI